MESATAHLEHHGQHSIQRLDRWGQTSGFCQMSRLPLAPATYLRFIFLPISSVLHEARLTRTMATWSNICTHLLSCQHLQEVPGVHSFTSVVLQCSIKMQFTT